MRYVFLDLETTSLDDRVAEPWEIGAVVRDVDLELGTVSADMEYRWLVEPTDMIVADPRALRVGGYYERTPTVPAWGADALRAPVNLAARWTDDDVAEGDCPAAKVGDLRYTSPIWSIRLLVARELARLLDGAHVIGATVDYDLRVLRRWMPDHGAVLCSDYHITDVTTLLRGYLLGLASGLAASVQTTAEFLRAGAQPSGGTHDSFRHLSSWVGYHQPAADRHTALGDALAARDVWDMLQGTPTVDIP